MQVVWGTNWYFYQRHLRSLKDLFKIQEYAIQLYRLRISIASIEKLILDRPPQPNSLQASIIADVLSAYLNMSLDASVDQIARLIDLMVYTVHDHPFILVSLLVIPPALLIFRTWLRAIALALQLFGVLGQCGPVQDS